jgi:hypothetical protein
MSSSSSEEPEPEALLVLGTCLEEKQILRRRRQSEGEMRSPVPERSLIIESDDDDDTQSAVATNWTGHGHDEEEPEQDSDSSSSSSSCATPRRGPSSPAYTQQWPQSYRSRRFLLPPSLPMIEEESLVVAGLPVYVSSYPIYPWFLGRKLRCREHLGRSRIRCGVVLLLCALSHPQFRFSEPLLHFLFSHHPPAGSVLLTGSCRSIIHSSISILTGH